MQDLVAKLDEYRTGRRFQMMKREIDNLRKLVFSLQQVSVKPGPNDG